MLFPCENSYDLLFYQRLHVTFSSVNYTNHVVHYIPSTYLSYNWKFVPFDLLHPIPLNPPPTSGNHKSDFFLETLFDSWNAYRSTYP